MRLSSAGLRGVLALFVLARSGAACAQERAFDIPSEPAAKALPEFAREANIQIIAPAVDLKGVTTPALKGALDLHAALSMLLSGTGLIVVSDDGRTIVLAKRSAPQHRATDGAPDGARTPPARQTATAVSSQLQEITVTATKSRLSAQKVPATVVAIDGDLLQSAGIRSVNDLSQIAPAIEFTPTRQNATTYIRGLGQSVTSPNVDPFVAINLNGANVPAQAAGLAFFDVGRVEILYGPQGTLYGRNSLAGVINVYTNRPSFEFGGDASVQYGNYNTLNLTGALNIPLSSTLAMRVAFNRLRHDGYVSDGADDQDEDDGRLSLLFRPSRRTSALLMVQYSHSGGFDEVLMNDPPLPCGRWCLPVDLRKIGQFGDVPAHIANLIITHHLTHNITITNTSAYNSIGGNVQLLSYVGNPFNPSSAVGAPHVENYSDELRLNFDGARMSGVAGLYAFHTNGSYFTTIVTANQGPQAQVGPFHDHASGEAAFADLTYSLTQRWHITGGVRYSHDARSLDGANGVFSSGVERVTQSYSGSRSNNRVDFKASAQYDITPRSLAYATFQTGYNGGGFSSAPVAPGSTVAAAFAPATVKSWIMGIKNRFLHNRAQLNAEAFYNDYTNYQVSARNIETGQNTIYNAARARTWGIQVSSRVLVTPDDELGISLDALRAKEDELVLPVPPFSNYSGLDLPFSPHLTIHADFRHTFELANGATVNFRLDSHYQTAEWLIYSHLKGSSQSGYTMTDASLTYHPVSDQWSLGLYSKNLENTYAYGAAGPGVPGPIVAVVYPPRTYGVRVTAKF